MIRRNVYLAAAHVLLAALLVVVVGLPNRRAGVVGWGALLTALAVIEGLFLFFAVRKRRSGEPDRGPALIVMLIWIFFLIWDLAASVLNAAHPVLVPAPENVFWTILTQWRVMLLNISYSLRLLAVGFGSGLILAVAAGLFVGWLPLLRQVVYPIATVLAPVPPVVFSPYLVAVMPTFRSASAVVIFLGVFWPTLLTTVNRVAAIDRQILDSARMLAVRNGTMIWKVLLPSIFPGVVSGLRVSVTTSLLMLNFAELMGATHGMGYYIQNSIHYANYTHAVAGIVVIGVVVTVLNQLVFWFQRHAVRWQP